MIKNHKIKIVVFGEKGSKKSQLLHQCLRTIDPDILQSLETHCMVGTLKQKKNLFHYKLYDTRLSKFSKIISNTFFPEIHVIIYFYYQESYFQTLTQSESLIQPLLHQKCFRIFAFVADSFPDSGTIQIPDPAQPSCYHFSIVQSDPNSISNLFSWLLFKVFEVHEINKENSRIQLSRQERDIDQCC